MRTSLLALLSLSLAACSRVAFAPPDVETRPKQYSSVLRDWQKLGLTDHFPKGIPAEATDVKLSAFPGFLQGGGWFQVHLTLPPATVEKIYAEATQQAKTFYDGGDLLTLVNKRSDGLPGTSFHTAKSESGDFPADYRIFVYDAHSDPDRPTGDFKWNHGDSRGVVICRTRHEVIYFAEQW